MFDFLPAVIRTPLAFVIVLGVLVFVHEMGHYLAARWRGVHVEAFSIGFGRPLMTWTDRVGTVWKLAWIPLGGYVKLHGQERPEDASPETRAGWIAGRTYHEKSPGSRAIVVAAGPIANFVLAAVLFTALFAFYGRPVAVPVVGEGAARHGRHPCRACHRRCGDRDRLPHDHPVRGHPAPGDRLARQATDPARAARRPRTGHPGDARFARSGRRPRHRRARHSRRRLAVREICPRCNGCRRGSSRHGRCPCRRCRAFGRC